TRAGERDTQAGGGLLRPRERAPKIRYSLVHELADNDIPVAVACRVLGVSRSGYTDWFGRPASIREQRNTELVKMIREIHEESRRSYGSPRVHAELTLGRGEQVSRKRVERLMREAGIQGIYRRRGRRNPVNEPTEEDLVKRAFDVQAPDLLWVTDITEHPTEEGKLYCAAVLDCFSRRIIGHSIDIRQTTKLVVDAMAAAVARRKPAKDATILHSDHGTQFTSWTFGKRLRDAGLLGSMGTVGDCFDNAMMESFWGSMQLELLDTRKWQTRAELAAAVFEWIECWYNPFRRHSSLGMLSPVDYEERHRTSNTTT
ncbi:IS3 family transposase, partial [Actinomadura sp. GC306]|uniref:IS3 family transposase n=1 Tax=Actinomadura sp. GC306 TaxID=2530367 RepID=UPI0010473CB6